MGGAQGGRTAWACSHAQGIIPVGNGNMHEDDMGWKGQRCHADPPSSCLLPPPPCPTAVPLPFHGHLPLGSCFSSPNWEDKTSREEATCYEEGAMTGATGTRRPDLLQKGNRRHEEGRLRAEG